DAPGDVDVFAFGAGADRLRRLKLFGPQTGAGDTGYGSALVPQMTVTDQDGVVLASVSAGDPVAAQGVADLEACLTIGFVPAVGGTYFVRVEDAAGGGGAGFTYWLEVE